VIKVVVTSPELELLVIDQNFTSLSRSTDVEMRGMGFFGLGWGIQT
jgi:hypothetical protein